MSEGDPKPLKLTKNFYRVDEVAHYFNISTRSVYRLIEEGRLFPVKIRNCLRVPVEEIRRFEREIRGKDPDFSI